MSHSIPQDAAGGVARVGGAIVCSRLSGAPDIDGVEPAFRGSLLSEFGQDAFAADREIRDQRGTGCGFVACPQRLQHRIV